jgi:hypothetical protein
MRLAVVFDDDGNVIATARRETSEGDGPTDVGLVGAAGHHVEEVEVSDEDARLSPQELHSKLRQRRKGGGHASLPG